MFLNYNTVQPRAANRLEIDIFIIHTCLFKKKTIEKLFDPRASKTRPGLQILFSASCVLDHWRPDSKVDRFVPSPRRPLVSICFICINIGSFVFHIIVFPCLVTEERTDGRTNGQPENITPSPASLA